MDLEASAGDSTPKVRTFPELIQASRPFTVEAPATTWRLLFVTLLVWTLSVALAAYVKFDPIDSGSYTAATSVSIYDSLGESHTLSTYYVKDGTVGAPANSWLEFNLHRILSGTEARLSQCSIGSRNGSR